MGRAEIVFRAFAPDVVVCYALILLFKFSCIGLAVKRLIDLILNSFPYDIKSCLLGQALAC